MKQGYTRTSFQEEMQTEKVKSNSLLRNNQKEGEEPRAKQPMNQRRKRTGGSSLSVLEKKNARLRA